MALTITATARPAVFAVDLTITGAAGAAFTIEAVPSGRAPYTVRAIGDPTADPALVRDHEPPFGVPIRYTVTTDTETATYLLADGVDARGCVLSSTMRPASALPVVLLADRPHEWETRSAWFDVIGRRDPLVSVDGMRYRAGDWQLYARGTDARAQLIALLSTGEPLLLRASAPELVDDAIALPMRVTEEPHVDESGGRVFTVRYQAVTRTLGPYVGLGDWTYADVPLAAATYSILLDRFATYGELYAGPPSGGAKALPELTPVSWGVSC